MAVQDILRNKPCPVFWEELVALSSLSEADVQSAVDQLKANRELHQEPVEGTSSSVLWLLLSDQKQLTENTEGDDVRQSLEDKRAMVLTPPRTPSTQHMRKSFRSPLLQTHTASAYNRCAVDKVKETLKEMSDKLKCLRSEVEELSESYSAGELQQHIDLLHEYNEVKDAAQIIIGRLAEIRGTTTKALHEHFDMSCDG